MDKTISCILDLSKDLNKSIYLVGGSIRDGLLNRPWQDLDFALAGDIREFLKILADTLEGTFISLNPEENQYRVVLKKGIILDFGKLRGKTIEEDLIKRDFTINAMAYDLNNGWPIDESRIIDPCGGRKDLGKRLIKHVNDKSFDEDPIRMLRAVRLMAELDFGIEDDTVSLIKEKADKIKESAGERIAAELFNILKENKTYYYLGFMDKYLGILDKIFPEINEMKEIGECKYHVVDSWTHSIYTVKVAESVIYTEGYFEKHIKEAYERHTSEIIASNRTRLQLIKLGALFHDIGKPSSRRVDSKGRVRFKGHENTGAEIIKKYAERFNLSLREREMLYRYIALHMNPLVMYLNNDVSGTALYKLFNQAGEETLDILLIALADIVATRRLLDPEEEMGIFKVHTEYIANNYLTRYKPIEKISNFITGKEVMEILGLSEGVLVGDVLEELKKDIYFGRVEPDRESVLEHIKSIGNRL